MSMQKGSSTTTQRTDVPDWYGEAAQNMTRDFINAPQAQLAGLTPDQLRSGELSRIMAQNAFSGSGLSDYAGQIASAGGPVTAADIRDNLNPYLQDVGRQVLTDMRREKDNAIAGAGARSANAVAFGGSGPALERGQIERGYNQNVGRAMTDILSSGWDRATNLANANADRKMSALTAAYGAASGAAGDEYNRQSSAIDRLLGYGTLTQAQAQKALDVPYTSMQRYASLVPFGQSTTTPTYFNPLEQLLGIGLAGSRMYSNFNGAQK